MNRRSRRSRSARGFSICELLITIPVLTGIMVLMAQAFHAATAWRDASDDVVSMTTKSEHLLAAVREATLSARPIAALSIGPRGELAERPLEGAQRVWQSPGAFVLRSRDAYWIFEVEGRSLVRRRIGFDGRAEATVVVTGVERASWVPARRHVGYEVMLARVPSPVSGFVAYRTDETPEASPPSAPMPATRYVGGGK